MIFILFVLYNLKNIILKNVIRIMINKNKTHIRNKYVFKKANIFKD